MRYHDTSTREQSEALATWLKEVLTDEASELRIQSGYFSYTAMGLFQPLLTRAVSADLITKVLIGSNDSATIRAHVAELMKIMGIPRPNAHLGIVSFGQGLFHPKIYHVRRTDGSQAAFVGSANLTREGLALNVESGISLETRDSDDEAVLSKIAASIDAWFSEPAREGFCLVDAEDVLNRLVAEGILSETRPPRSTGNSGNGANSDSRPRLKPLLGLPSAKVSPSQGAGTGAPSATLEDGYEETFEPNVATPATVTFGMTLQNTDVGVGQTDPTQTTQRRSPEVFIPMKAFDLKPAFWGWPNNFTPDNAWATKPPNKGQTSNAAWIAAQAGNPVNPLRPRIKMDWHDVSVKLVGQVGLTTATIWFNPIKKDIRIRAEALRSSGSVGDIMLVKQGAPGCGYDFEIEIVTTADKRFATYVAKLNISITNSQKKIGYF